MATPPTPRELEKLGAQALCEELLQQGYLAARILEDGSVAALGDLLYTRSIITGCTPTGWSRRFCFEDRDLASRRFEELRHEDDVPLGHIARRGRW